MADGENLRQRLTKQIQDAKIFGIQSFCKDLLEVADTLGHATRAVPKEQITDQNPHLKNLYDGLILTKNSLDQVFKRHGLEIIDPLNTKFDPNMHEALFQKVCSLFIFLSTELHKTFHFPPKNNRKAKMLNQELWWK